MIMFHTPRCLNVGYVLTPSILNLVFVCYSPLRFVNRHLCISEFEISSLLPIDTPQRTFIDNISSSRFLLLLVSEWTPPIYKESFIDTPT